MALGIIFPGQGSQSVGMLAELAASHPCVAQTFEEGADALGFDLWDLVAHGPAERLNQTQITQPAMLAAGVATWRVWQEQGGARPELMAGHSLGEYTALVCAESLAFADAIALVEQRGKLMQAAAPAGSGAMAAILGLEDEAVRQLCADAAQGEVVSAVNFNSPGQVVVAGNTAAVDRAVALARELGAKRAVLLPVSAPCHCALMRPAADALAARLADIRVAPPRIPVVNNADVATPSEPAAIREALTRQLYSPVRWVETVRYMAAHGVDRVVECGPGKVLAGLNRRIERDMRVQPVLDPQTLEQALKAA